MLLVLEERKGNRREYEKISRRSSTKTEPSLGSPDILCESFLYSDAVLSNYVAAQSTTYHLTYFLRCNSGRDKSRDGCVRGVAPTLNKISPCFHAVAAASLVESALNADRSRGFRVTL